MSYQQYGIKTATVERIKLKMKNPAVKERVKSMLHGVTKMDLQDRQRVRRLVRTAAHYLNEPLTEAEMENIVTFILAQKIDPSSTLHLLRLWGMFR